MKEEINQRLTIVLNALNSIAVSGKSNLANLSGSISLIEEVASMVRNIEIMDKPEQEEA